MVDDLDHLVDGDGILYVLATQGKQLAKGVAGDPARLLIGVGVLGGFTTFSAFSLDIVTLIERGSLGLALGYAVASVVGSVLALAAGLAAVRAIA